WPVRGLDAYLQDTRVCLRIKADEMGAAKGLRMRGWKAWVEGSGIGEPGIVAGATKCLEKEADLCEVKDIVNNQ
ncbi:MAG TPA: hypothetical protein VE035_05800, partial [Puia sp.]|nr:hypothetical protein [Puia sp.]